MRLAVDYAIDRDAINQAETLGYSKITGSIIPNNFEFFWQPPAYTYDPAKAKQLLTDAGYPNGFDGGEYYCDSSYANIAEAVANYLERVGIHTHLLPLERAAFFKGYAEKKFRNIIQGASGAFGNAATRIEAFVASGESTPMAAIRTSTGSSRSRRPRWTGPDARRRCTRSSSSCTTK